MMEKRLIELDEYKRGKAFILPEKVSFVRQNHMPGFEHLTIIVIDGQEIAVEGEASDIYLKILG